MTEKKTQNKKQNTLNIHEDLLQLELICKGRVVQQRWITIWRSLIKLSTCGPTIPFLGIYFRGKSTRPERLVATECLSKEE